MLPATPNQGWSSCLQAQLDHVMACQRELQEELASLATQQNRRTASRRRKVCCTAPFLAHFGMQGDYTPLLLWLPILQGSSGIASGQAESC